MKKPYRTATPSIRYPRSHAATRLSLTVSTSGIVPYDQSADRVTGKTCKRKNKTKIKQRQTYQQCMPRNCLRTTQSASQRNKNSAPTMDSAPKCTCSGREPTGWKASAPASPRAVPTTTTVGSSSSLPGHATASSALFPDHTQQCRCTRTIGFCSNEKAGPDSPLSRSRKIYTGHTTWTMKCNAATTTKTSPHVPPKPGPTVHFFLHPKAKRTNEPLDQRQRSQQGKTGRGTLSTFLHNASPRSCRD